MASEFKSSRKQIRFFGFALAGTSVILTLSYFLLFRIEMVPAFTNLRESDASSITEILEKAGVPFELRNEGHAIFVPEERLAEARVAIGGSEAGSGNVIGFELFNSSDMGLTEFAQKINFQRAIQGELTRTIMAMEGVEFARVHLAIPERSVFRTRQGAPSAAVTVQMRPGHSLSTPLVNGIRQLVASSVPELDFSSVAVLDHQGSLLSGEPSATNLIDGLSARTALEQFYRARAIEAIGRTLPGVPIEIGVSARERDDAQLSATPRSPLYNDYYFSLLLRTPFEIAEEDRRAVERVVVDELGLDPMLGHALNFTVGTVEFGSSIDGPYQVENPERRRVVPHTDGRRDDGSWKWGDLANLPWRTLLLLAGMLLIVGITIRPKRRLHEQEAAQLAQELKLWSEEGRRNNAF